jgi:hypothetical protein
MQMFPHDLKNWRERNGITFSRPQYYIGHLLVSYTYTYLEKSDPSEVLKKENNMKIANSA